MKTLILNRINLRFVPYAELLSGDQLFLISDVHAVADPAAAQAGFERVELVGNYDRSGRVEQLAVAMHRAAGAFDRIVAVSEFDLLRTGRLRDFLHVPGQGYEAALAFRDKVLMKELARAGGVAVPAFRRVHTPLDVVTFAEEYGPRLVVKPVLGSGAVSTWIVQTGAELNALLDQDVFGASELPNALEVESFVDGLMYHVDGYVQDGCVLVLWPSLYLRSCPVGGGEGLIGSLTLAADNPLASRLVAFVERVLEVLPTPPTTGVHAEVFLTPYDELILCEVASRVGGPPIPDLFRAALGFDLVSAFVRGLGGRRTNVPDKRLRPRGVAAMVYLPARAGALEAAPASCPLPGVLDYRLIGEIGVRRVQPNTPSDFVAAFLFATETESKARQCALDAADWFTRKARWRTEE